MRTINNIRYKKSSTTNNQAEPQGRAKVAMLKNFTGMHLYGLGGLLFLNLPLLKLLRSSSLHSDTISSSTAAQKELSNQRQRLMNFHRCEWINFKKQIVVELLLSTASACVISAQGRRNNDTIDI